jgi:hypothetical protein
MIPDELMSAPSHREEIIGEFEFPAGTATKVVVFPVISPSRDDIDIMRRSAILEGYLSKERLFTQTGSSTEISTLELRRNAAQTELFLINMMRFSQGKSLAARCHMIQAAASLNRKLADRKVLRGELFLPSGFEGLGTQYSSVAESYDLSALERLACSSRTVASRAELIRKMRASASEQLLKNERLSGYAKRKETLMTAELTRYTAVETKVLAVDMMVAKLGKLRDNLANIKSTYDLVRDDTYGLNTAPPGVQSQLNQLNAIDYAQLEKDFSLTGSSDPTTGSQPKYQAILREKSTQYDSVIGEKEGLKAILKGYLDLYSQAPTDLQARLMPCSALLDAFNSVENLALSGSSTSATQLTTFKKAFSSCLNIAVTAFTEQRSRNQNQYRIDDKFAAYLAKLSNAVIEVKSRPN